MPSYDFYIDEDKQNHRLGVLAVSNAVALNQILESIRDQYGIRREVKWGAMDRFRLPVAVSWIRVAAWFHSVRFGSLPWPDNAQKGGILVEFFKTFLDRYGTTLPHGKFDSVAFLDFDNVDKQGNIHTYIVRRANLLRCYPLDSKSSNCLQLVDIMLGSWVRSGEIPSTIPMDLYKRWSDVDSALKNHERLATPAFTGAESRRYLAGYASEVIRRLVIP